MFYDLPILWKTFLYLTQNQSILDITRHDIEPLNAQLNITISPEDYNQRVQQALANLGKQSNLPGFRKGHASTNVIKKRFGNRVLADELNKILNEALNDYIKEQELDMIGRPVQDESQKLKLDINSKRDYTFSFDVGFRPAIEFDLLTEGNTQSFTRYNIEVEDKHIDDRILMVRRQYGKNQQMVEDDIQINDVVYVDLIELDESGEIKEGGHLTNNVLPVDIFTEEAQSQITFLRKGEVVDLDIFASFNKKKQEIAKIILNLPENEQDKVSNMFRVKITDISRVELAEMTPEFFKQMSAKEDMETEEDFRGFIKDILTYEYDNQSRSKVIDAVNQQIRETSIDLPEGYMPKLFKSHVQNLERMNKARKKKKEKPYNIPDYDGFLKQVKNELISTALLRKFEVEVTEDEVKQVVYQEAQRRVQMYYGQANNQMVQRVAQDMYGDQNYVNQVQNSVVNHKLNNHLLNSVNLTEENISLDAFNELAN